MQSSPGLRTLPGSLTQARTPWIWLPPQRHLSPLPYPLTLQLHCLPDSLRVMLSHDLCLPTLMPIPVISPPRLSSLFTSMYLTNS